MENTWTVSYEYASQEIYSESYDSTIPIPHKESIWIYEGFAYTVCRVIYNKDSSRVEVELRLT